MIQTQARKVPIPRKLDVKESPHQSDYYRLDIFFSKFMQTGAKWINPTQVGGLVSKHLTKGHQTRHIASWQGHNVHHPQEHDHDHVPLHA